ncbi:MAG: M48 family metalloprotease [Desulfobacterales bacterium]|jgi:TPR repeat protein
MKHLVILLTVCWLAFGCTTPGPVCVDGDPATPQYETMLWQRAKEEQAILNNSGLLYPNSELEDYLNHVARRLQPDGIPADLSFKIKVIQDPKLNAFAFPNGVIYVHTGILARMDNEAQLALLLAHEMTHCINRHTMRVLGSIKNRSKFIANVQKTLARIAMTQDVAKFLGLTGSMAAVAGYTRELETEADRIGLDIAANAGYDVSEAVRLFEHLKNEMTMEGLVEPYFFGTHPNVEQRIANVRGWLNTGYRSKNAGVTNTLIFQSKLSKVILDNASLDLRLGRFLIARRGVEKFLQIKPNDPQAYYLLGEIHRQRGQEDDLKAAMGFYQKAISLNPSFAAPHKAIGLIHYKDGEKHQAKKYFETCLLLSPDSPDKAYIQGYLNHCSKNGEG